jgi:signal transduction histidine kinase
MIDVTKHMIAENALERKMKSLSTEKASLIQAKKQLDLETRQLSNEVNKIVLGSQEIGKGDTGYRFKISDFKRLISVVSVINATNTKLEEIINVSQHNTQELLKREEISREYTRNLKSSLDDLKRLDQMKTNFLSITSHELKTPLTPITSQLQLLLGRVYGDINEKQEESLNMVLRNIKRLTQLINDIATSSKIVRGKFFLASRLTDIVENVTEDFITTAMTKKVDLKIKIEKSIPKMMIDNDRFTQVLTNLISNSMKFNKPNGNIWVDISQVMKDGDNYLKVSVKDTGIGIPKKKQAKLFTPFYQVDASRARKYSGTGLGLSICKSIVEMMGGNIWVDSSSGKGATFSFIIPIRKKEKLKTTSPEKSEPQPEIITTPIVREMTRKGLITKEGKIIEGVMLNNLEGKIKLNYREIIKSIINKARELIKDSAINKANTVSGISVSYADNPSVRIKGSPKEAMENLLAAYRDLLGYLMDTIEEEIAREIIMKKLGVSI